jgi:Mannosylglycerate hydrolase MGH1-like glycoside hydrolase domain
MPEPPTAEEIRLAEARERRAQWKRWGPYLSERQWGTVREDYSADGSAWTYFPHDHARSRAYRWGEDGLAGISDRHQFICLALALWNGRDPILKERAFGLTGHEGNHGEDVKEYYFYLDNTPTHAYMKWLYKYPQAEFPYQRLVDEAGRRGRGDPEYELLDTGVFAESRYFDVVAEYAKEAPDVILCRVTVTNRGPERAPLYLLPTLWFRNTWSWSSGVERPSATARDNPFGAALVEIAHPHYGGRWLWCEGAPELLFTENETNDARLFGVANATPYVKDAFHEYVVHGRREVVNPARTGTKAAACYRLDLAAGQSATIRLRLTDHPYESGLGHGLPAVLEPFGASFDAVFVERIAEAEAFYGGVIPGDLSEDGRRVHRQAFAGLLWSKQFYHYDVGTWLAGDPAQPPPPHERCQGRNSSWTHLYNADVISMPDKWEYPWYAAWDLAFHTIPLALVDADFAKEQLILFLREWYLHPNGQIPAYEWSFGDVNPPVHAWAARRIFQIERRLRGTGDRAFLMRVFHKLLLNFTWWVNRKDAEGNNIFEGGFLGLDNIGVFDRGAALPTGGSIEQCDGTSWMAMYCLNLLAIAMELAREDPVYEDVASKFFEHFVWIADAANNIGHECIELWDEEDGFYYDVLHLPDGQSHQLKVRSVVGLIPMFAVEILEPEVVAALPGFTRRMHWFMENHPILTEHLEETPVAGGQRRLLSLVWRDRLRRVLERMLDEAEFLSPHGIRALSRYHEEHPYSLSVNGIEYRIAYEPAESRTGMFGGNSNWRGPVWFPINHLIIETLQKYHYYYGDSFLVEFPTGSGRKLNLWDVAAELSRRLTRTFLRDEEGRRPVYGGREVFQSDPHWRDLVLFYEYFHGDNGAGLGASHQTGWTGLVAKLLQQSGE